MENPVTRAVAQTSLHAGTTSPSDASPIVLALPARRESKQQEPPLEDADLVLEQLQAVATNSSPQIELALLTDLLQRNLGLAQSLTDPHEVHAYHHPLASINAYKHRLHALRREFVVNRLQTVELDMQLNESRSRVQRLENHVQFLEQTLQQMRTSRAWKWTERCSRWRQTILGWLRRWRRTQRWT